MLFVLYSFSTITIYWNGAIRCCLRYSILTDVPGFVNGLTMKEQETDFVSVLSSLL